MPGKKNGRPTIFTKEVFDKLEYPFSLAGIIKNVARVYSPATLSIRLGTLLTASWTDRLAAWTSTA